MDNFDKNSVLPTTLIKWTVGDTDSTMLQMQN